MTDVDAVVLVVIVGGGGGGGGFAGGGGISGGGGGEGREARTPLADAVLSTLSRESRERMESREACACGNLFGVACQQGHVVEHEVKESTHKHTHAQTIGQRWQRREK